MTPAQAHCRITNKAFTNLTSFKLKPTESTLLSKGLSFIPTPFISTQPIYKSQIHTAFQKLTRSMRLQFMFKDEPPALINRRLYLPNTNFQPPEAPELVERFLRKSYAQALTASVRVNPNVFKKRNFTADAHRDFKALCDKKDIIIKAADKNLGPVLLTREWYEQEALRQLHDSTVYKPLDESEADSTMTLFLTKFKTLRHSLAKFCDKNIMKFLNQIDKPVNDGFTYPRFYHLPKIHKPGPLRGRPIVASHSSLTTPLSTWLDFTLQPFVELCTTAIKDSKSLVNELESLHLPKDVWFVTADVTSLYPSIPTKDGIEIVGDTLRFLGMTENLLTVVLAALTLVLTFNVFTFGKLFFHQLQGTAMGTPCAPAFAILFLFGLERKLHPSWAFFKRYIDDLLAMFSTKAAALDFVKRYNELHRNIKITWEISDSTVNFLDLTIYKGARFQSKGLIDLATFGKAMNPYLYVPFSSHHPVAMKKGFIHGELLRFIRNSSDFPTFETTRKTFYDRLRARGYPHRFITEVMDKIKYKNRPDFLKPGPPKENKKTPLLISLIFNPHTKSLNLGRIFRDNWTGISTDPELNAIFPDPPLLAFKKTDNLLNMICKNSKS